jgi:hypothetical protein
MKRNALLLSPDASEGGSSPENTNPAATAAKPPKPPKPPGKKPAAKGKPAAKPAAPKGKAPAAKAAAKPAKPAKAAKPAEERQRANGLTRPLGAKTRIPWDIADQISAKKGEPAKRAEVLEACEKRGVRPATAATQYGRWRRFNGLSGRS